MSESTENADERSLLEPSVADADATAEGGAAPAADSDSAGDLADQLAAAQAEAEENLSKYMRLAADMENLRKRTTRDVEHAHKYAIERLAGELLEVVDSLEMGLAAGESASADALLEGSQATLKLLLGALTKSGIELLDPEGEVFDPQWHEAMTTQPSATAEPGSVIAVVQKGYQLNGRLLRPARVIVAREVAD